MDRTRWFLVGGFVAASLWCWSAAAVRLRRQGSLLPLEPRRAPPWGLIDLWPVVLCVAMAVLAAAQMFALAARRLDGLSGQPPSQQYDVPTIYDSLISLGIVLASALVILLRTGASVRDLGVDLRKAPADLRLGCAAFLMLAPPVYAIQWLVQWGPVKWLERAPWFQPRHPFVEFLERQPDAASISVAVVVVVLVAPLVEEYLFRVLLQGWLEKAAVCRSPMQSLLVGGASDSPSAAVAEAEGAAGSGGAAPSTAQHDASRGGSDGQGDIAAYPSAAAPEAQPEDAKPPPSWPIAASAAIFSVMHITHGLDWIPLFPLALGLGYLYQRTHRLLPCLLVHLLLNGCSLAVLVIHAFSHGG
jgi:membrane protease YdiL (CAAX protease family)